jgi:hypothetical protein
MCPTAFTVRRLAVSAARLTPDPQMCSFSVPPLLTPDCCPTLCFRTRNGGLVGANRRDQRLLERKNPHKRELTFQLSNLPISTIELLPSVIYGFLSTPLVSAPMPAHAIEIGNLPSRFPPCSRVMRSSFGLASEGDGPQPSESVHTRSFPRRAERVALRSTHRRHERLKPMSILEDAGFPHG